MGLLGLGPHVVERLGSGVWVSASFQSFVLTAEGKYPRKKGNCPAGKCPGEMSGGNVLHSILATL